MENIRFTFFNIAKCGYYAHSNDTPVFGSISDTLKQLQLWSTGKELSLTRTSNNSEEDDSIGTYLFDIKEFKDYWILACWNEIPANMNSVSSISANSKVGAPQVHDNSVKVGTIPGYPTYFLFFPSTHLMATLRIDRNPTGRVAMEKYVGNFLETLTSYVRFKVQDGVEIITGHTNKSDNTPMKVRPKIILQPIRKKGHEEFLRANVGKIRKIIKTSHINTSLTTGFSLFRLFTRLIPGLDPTVTTKSEKRVKIEIDYEPSLSEFNALVQEEESSTGKYWDDVGFDLSGQSKTLWLGRSRASESIEIDVIREDGVIDTEKLSIQISEKMSQIMEIANG